MANELKKPAARGEDASTEKPDSNSGKLPTKAVVNTLATNVAGLTQKAAKLRGEMGAAIKAASDDDNVHKGAFRQAMKERQMEPDERANFQRHLAKYRKDLNIELQGDLLKDAPAR